LKFTTYSLGRRNVKILNQEEIEWLQAALIRNPFEKEEKLAGVIGV
jgi:hypothetical protein